MTGRLDKRADKRPDKRDRYDRRHPDRGALDRLMRERVSLSPMTPPRPLHKMGARADNDETATTGQRT